MDAMACEEEIYASCFPTDKVGDYAGLLDSRSITPLGGYWKRWDQKKGTGFFVQSFPPW